MPSPQAPTTDVADESMIDKIMELFQSNTVAVDYGTDPQGWVEQNLPEGTEAADVARCMPDVAERLGGQHQANAVRYNAHHGAHAHPATSTVVNEISYSYNTIYQQNTYIHAEEGSQVVNIQGDNNHVDQTQIDVNFGVDPDQYEPGYETEDGYEGEDAPVDDHDEPELPEDTDEADTGEGDGTEDGYADPTTDPLDPADTVDPVDPVDPVEDGWQDPIDPVDPVEEAWEDPMDPIDPIDPVDPGHQNPFENPATEVAEAF